MYVARVPNRNSPPAYLLREGWREGGKVKTRTLANLSHWPLRKIEALRRVLADLTSTWFEGRTCPLAKHGHNRDRKSGKLQIVFGLLCAANGCPIAVEVFEGNTGDPTTLKPQVDKLKERFALSRVVLVGDRGMITSKQIETVLKPAGLEWITALRNASIRSLVAAGSLQLSLFDERDMAEIASP